METEEIQKRLGIYLQAYGVDNVAQALKYIAKNTSLLSENNEDLVKKYGNIEGAISGVSKEYSKYSRKITRANAKIKAQLGSMTKQVIGLGGAFSSLGSGLKSLILPASFADAVKITFNYEKALLAASARVNRLGIGLGQLEDKLRSVSAQAGFTRVETISLFKDFERGMRFVSLEDFGNILERIRQTVGSNVEETKNYLSSLTSLSQKYPLLTKRIMKVDKELDKYNETLVTGLYLAGKIGDEEYRSLTALTKLNKQISLDDQLKEARIKKQVRAMQEFKMQIESVMMYFGDKILPYLVDAADAMKGMVSTTNDWLNILKAVGAAYVGIKALQIASQLSIAKAAAASTTAGVATAGAAGLASMSVIASVSAVVIAAMMIKYGLDKRAEKYASEGEYKKAGATNLVSAAGDIATKAVLGGWLAAKASGGNPWAVGAGAVAGGGAATYQNWERITKGTSRVTGEEEKKQRETREGYREKLMSGIESITGQASIDEKKRLEYLKQSREIALELKKSGIAPSSYKEAVANVEESKKAQEAAMAKFDKKMTDKTKRAFGDTIKWKSRKQFKADIKRRKEEISNMNMVTAKMIRRKDDPEQIKYSVKLREKRELALENIIERRRKAERGDEELKGAVDTHTKARVKAETMKSYLRSEAEHVKDLNALYQVQSQNLSIIISKATKMGDVGFEEIEPQMKKAFDMLDATVSKQEDVRDVINEQVKLAEASGAEAKDKLGNVIEIKSLNEDVQKIIEEQGLAEKTIVQLKTQSANLDTKILGKFEEQQKIYNETLGLLKERVKSTRLEADYMGKMVRLADNYAIGVGASAKLRAQHYQSLGDVITEKEKELSLNRQIQQSQLEQYGKIPIELLNKERALQNELLDIELERAGVVKSLRDGWVSAMSAMNTGAGVFTKILYDQNKGMGQSLKLAGDAAVMSGKSGSRFGGYDTSEQLGIHGIKRSKKFNLAYLVGRGVDDISGIEKGERRKIQRQIAAQNRIAGSGANVGSTIQGHKFGTSIISGMAKGGVLNRPTNVIAGEAGPEAYVPLPDGKRIPVELKGIPDSIKRDVSVPNVPEFLSPTNILAGESEAKSYIPPLDDNNTPVELRESSNNIQSGMSVSSLVQQMPDIQISQASNTPANVTAMVDLKNTNFHIRIDGAKDIGSQVARQVESKIQTSVVDAIDQITR
jgi:hypothetical protein